MFFFEDFCRIPTSLLPVTLLAPKKGHQRHQKRATKGVKKIHVFLLKNNEFFGRKEGFKACF